MKGFYEFGCEGYVEKLSKREICRRLEELKDLKLKFSALCKALGYKFKYVAPRLSRFEAEKDNKNV